MSEDPGELLYADTIGRAEGPHTGVSIRQCGAGRIADPAGFRSAPEMPAA